MIPVTHPGITNSERCSSLRSRLQEKGFLRIIEAHNPISALIAENVICEDSGTTFDGIWSSSLTDSTSRGLPDIEKLRISDRISNINEIFSVTTIPMIVDADTGGLIEHFGYDVRLLERSGVSAVVIEDKKGLKKNSLLGNDVVQIQESAEIFCEKIRYGKQVQVSREFMIIARIESLILETGMEDALTRAAMYVEAGADAILIHSRKQNGNEIFEFVRNFRRDNTVTPIIVVPTSYNTICCAELQDAGINVVIYANHMLRAAYLAMKDVAFNILKHGRSYEVEPNCLSIKEVLNLIPGTY
ncbi:phosphoenolpyruvate mutase [Vibrio rhizosphaerae]|uniref:phosphoenolpyruvate mutase n=1 Tax=Vibrio rhizosphaerae TaxID=398736 RepID=A0ABU4ISP8_9VIBR|nr:phosphoenolpyruvate mutase [Vibrio rhizosphaerae]MDW6092142.1 phosphoenolpyruvate mutase [Vibrio rhizosphaerae]